MQGGGSMAAIATPEPTALPQRTRDVLLYRKIG